LRPDGLALPQQLAVILPLGIGFFSFHHIISIWRTTARGARPYRLRDHALLTVPFPQIPAGPPVRHCETARRFPLDPWRRRRIIIPANREARCEAGATPSRWRQACNCAVLSSDDRNNSYTFV
jgi:hypothetical protein